MAVYFSDLMLLFTTEQRKKTRNNKAEPKTTEDQSSIQKELKLQHFDYKCTNTTISLPTENKQKSPELTALTTYNGMRLLTGWFNK